MVYELYIDVFFLVNFVLDYLILNIVKQMLKCSATHGRILLGAIVGAGLTSVLVCIPCNALVKNLLLHGFVNTAMIFSSLRVRKRAFIKAWFLLYITGIMMGGLLEFVKPYIGNSFEAILLFLFVALCCYELISKIMDYLERHLKMNAQKCKVILIAGDCMCEVNAVIDTGNMLYDSFTGKPVHIISNNAIKKLTIKIEKVRYIPYHTVQGKNSVMPLITIDKMRIQGNQNIEIQEPFLGISECTQFGDGDYDLILHPKDL